MVRLPLAPMRRRGILLTSRRRQPCHASTTTIVPVTVVASRQAGKRNAGKDTHGAVAVTTKDRQVLRGLARGAAPRRLARRDLGDAWVACVSCNRRGQTTGPALPRPPQDHAPRRSASMSASGAPLFAPEGRTPNGGVCWKARVRLFVDIAGWPDATPDGRNESASRRWPLSRYLPPSVGSARGAAPQRRATPTSGTSSNSYSGGTDRIAGKPAAKVRPWGCRLRRAKPAECSRCGGGLIMAYMAQPGRHPTPWQNGAAAGAWATGCACATGCARASCAPRASRHRLKAKTVTVSAGRAGKNRRL